jgi:hypothetical protein
MIRDPFNLSALRRDSRRSRKSAAKSRLVKTVTDKERTWIVVLLDRFHGAVQV